MAPVKLGSEAVREDRGGIAWVQFPRLGDPKVVQHGVSTRQGGVSRAPWGSLNLSRKVGDDPLRVKENQDLFSKSFGLDLSRTAWVDQVHGDRVVTVTAQDLVPGGGPLGEADALITQEKGVTLQILVADCLPVFLFDPIHQAVGLAHAGWRGTLSHVAAKTLLAMKEAYGTDPVEVLAALGPCIGPCCYEVGEDVKKEFEGVFPWAEEVFQPSLAGAWKLDLASANARQLIEMGLREVHLIRSGLCTVGQRDLFYSHRAEAAPGSATGRMGAFIRLNG